jgi:hypothetical protein
VTYPLAVVRGGNYRLRARIAGSPSAPASAELARYGELKPVKSFSIVPASAMGWVDAGVTHVDAGAYTATFLLPAGTALEYVEFAPPCVAPIEPPGGWRASAVLRSEELAVTAVKALDQEVELPPAATPVEVSAEAFQAQTAAVSQASTGPAAGLEGLWLKAGPGGTQAAVFVELPQDGLYTISVFGIAGAGQSWLGDACRKSVLCGTEEPGKTDEPRWRVLMTAPFSSGRHFFTVVLGRGAAIQRMRAERKKETPPDYVATLRRLGFDVGPEGPIARNRAVDAMRFLEGRGAQLKQSQCGDVVLPEAPAPGQATGLQIAQIPGPAQPIIAGAPPVVGAPGVPLGATPAPPIAAPSPTVPVTTPPTTTPTTVPPTTTPAPPPTTVPPTTLPPPPTLPSPPNPSPVRPVTPSPSPG